jgi:hypothetical protein
LVLPKKGMALSSEKAIVTVRALVKINGGTPFSSELLQGVPPLIGYNNLHSSTLFAMFQANKSHPFIGFVYVLFLKLLRIIELE